MLLSELNYCSKRTALKEIHLKSLESNFMENKLVASLKKSVCVGGREGGGGEIKGLLKILQNNFYEILWFMSEFDY